MLSTTHSASASPRLLGTCTATEEEEGEGGGEGEEQEGEGEGGKRRLRPCSSRTSLPYLAMPLTCIPSYDINIPTYVATCTYRTSACMLRAHLPLQVRGYGRRREEKEVKVGSMLA